MCHHVLVKLTPSDEQAVRKMYGIMVPVFASIVLLVVAVIAVSHQPRSGEVLTAAAAKAPIAARR
jgi:hypothetical protein